MFTKDMNSAASRIRCAADEMDALLIELRAEIEQDERALEEKRSLLVEIEMRQRQSSLRASVARRRRILQPNESFGPMAQSRDGSKEEKTH